MVDKENQANILKAGDRLPVTVLTGFLGSGKTTLLKHLLHQPDMENTAVIINEFGEVGLDHKLVEKADEDMVVMDSGCLCCSIRGDLVATLRGLLKKRWNREIPPFDRLMIETTGLADPAPILHTLMTDPVVSNRYRLDGVISCIDAVAGMQTLDSQPESVKQAAVADRLLLTKTDIAKNIEPLCARLEKLNPAAPQIKVINGQIAASALSNMGLYDPSGKIPDVAGWLQAESYANVDHHADDHSDHHADDHADHHADDHADHPPGSDHHIYNHADISQGHGHHHDPNRHGDGIRAFCISYDKPIKWDSFVDWMESLIATNGNNLLRMKGILDIVEAEGPVAVHGVQHVFHPPSMLAAWPDDARRSHIVMITREINRAPVEKMFQKFIEEPMP